MTDEQPQPQPESAAEYIDVAGVAVLLGVCHSTVLAWRRHGEMPAGEVIRIDGMFRSRKFRWRRDDIDQWLASSRRPAKGKPKKPAYARGVVAKKLPDDAGEMITAAGLAELFGTKRETIGHWWRGGAIPAPTERKGKASLWKRDVIAEFVKSLDGRRPGLPRGRPRKRSRINPTPQEIAERCAEIQRGWKDWERERRRIGRDWSIVEVSRIVFDETRVNQIDDTENHLDHP